MKRLLLLLILLPALAGCAAQKAFENGKAALESGNYDEGLAQIQGAMKLEPKNYEYRAYYLRQRELAVQRLLAQADTAKTQARWDAAAAAYTQALALDQTAARAKSGLESLAMERRHRATLDEGEDLFKKGRIEEAYGKARAVLTENNLNRDAQSLIRRIEEKQGSRSTDEPTPNAALRKPISLEFRDAGIKTVFELISRNTGLNFIFDKDVKPDLRTTIFVRNTSIEEIIRFILVTNQLERKFLNENTILVYPNTPAKIKEYQELIVKSFYLANADVKQTANMIRSLVKTKDVFIDEKVNLLVMRDTRDAVRMAEKLIATQDLAEPEVMLEVEVMEVSSSIIRNLGVRYPNQVSYSIVGAAGTAGSLMLPEWLNRSAGLYRISVTDPLLIINLKDQLSRANLLANPRIRVKNRDKAKIHIGDKVPVITTTSTATGFVSTSASYIDIGLKLDVEPNIFLEDEVGIKIGLEVSNIVKEVPTAGGGLTYQIGTRNASTVLRLKDGETQILAGLINDDERKAADRVPGLGELPVIGRLFSSQSDTIDKKEIVLLITPRVVRNIARPEVGVTEFLSGTESGIGAPPLRLSPVDPAKGPPAGGAAAKPSGAAPLAPTSGTQLTLQAPPQMQLGKEFTVAIRLATDKTFRNASLDMAYDQGRLSVVRVEAGSLIKQAGQDASFSYSVQEKAGRVNLSITGKGGVGGSGDLATVTFRIIGDQPGTTMVRLDAVYLSDASGGPLPVAAPSPQSIALSR
jgi:general secretion pathway protein D